MSLLRSVRSPRAGFQAHAYSAIPTPSEASESSFSFWAGNDSSDSEEETIYEDVAPRVSRENREENINSISEDNSG